MHSEQQSETINLASASPSETFQIGETLASSLYHEDTLIMLFGDLGAGKTTFVQGFAKGLGIEDEITSPTFALENRYGNKLMHVDLYRLEQKEAQRIVEEGEEFPGLRVVEWSERLGVEEVVEGIEGTEVRSPISPITSVPFVPSVRIYISEITPTSRNIRITFNDIPLPDRKQIEEWRKDLKLPEHVGVHCDVVGEFSEKCADLLLNQGIITRPKTLRKAGELHDLFRFVDFSPERHSKIPGVKEASEETWNEWKRLGEKYPGGHEAACSSFLCEKGYPELAEMILPHRINAVDDPEALKTTEQKIIFYADKRILYDKIVSLDERFDDFIVRYGGKWETEEAKGWREKTKKLEGELFGENVPS